MGKFYGEKILSGMINPKTGKTWTINDVPDFWKVKTENWLKENQNKK